MTRTFHMCRALYCAGVIMGAAWAGAAAAQPSILARPSAEDVTSAWPPAAARARTEGVAFMRCRVGPGGGAVDCILLKESPEGQGFGAALAALQPKFRFDRARAGESVVVGASWPAPETWPDWPSNPAAIFGSFLRGMSGNRSASVACVVETDGTFSNCVVAMETDPTGVLGRRALEAVAKARARPASYQGRPVRSMMVIPFRVGRGGTG